MRIELKCRCGASAIFEDNRGAYIKDGGKVDERGRKFLIEVRADEWQEKHSACLTSQKTGKRVDNFAEESLARPEWWPETHTLSLFSQ